MDMNSKRILKEYHDNIGIFQSMREIVQEQLTTCVKGCNLYVNALETRIKTKESLAGKLDLKGQKYQSLSDITDILGARVITFYTDEVDKIAVLVERTFDIDWENSVDKRKALELDRFGYMSLHYVCRIPKTLFHDPERPLINEYRFEIQMRSALQHVWATMYHDTGYKSGIEIPNEYLRNLNRIAGMLELADEQFSRIRKEITDYRRHVQSLVAGGQFQDVPLNGDTFRSYLRLNPFKKLINKIAGINQAEVYEDSLMRYLDILIKMGFKTLADVENLIKENCDGAYQLALHQLTGTDLDIVALSLAMQNLCIIYIVKHGGGEPGLNHFYRMLYGPSDYNAEHAHQSFEQVSKLNLL